jgi:Mg2+ and Co2+ transporter CorA
MIRTLLYDTVSGHLDEGNQELVKDWKQDGNKLLWLDLSDEPDDIAKQLLCGDLDLHPLAVQDALRDRHPPKVEDFENYWTSPRCSLPSLSASACWSHGVLPSRGASTSCGRK